MVKHRCVDCGYLAVRDKETRRLHEAERDETGNVAFPKVRSIASGGILLTKYDLPICFTRNSNLLSEYGARPSDADAYNIWQANTQEVLIRERDCSHFTDWLQGFTPKEHLDMNDRKTMLEMEERRRRNDRKWHWIELFAIVLGTGFFTLLGMWIS